MDASCVILLPIPTHFMFLPAILLSFIYKNASHGAAVVKNNMQIYAKLLVILGQKDDIFHNTFGYLGKISNSTYVER